jgi:predicted nucleic acid-binding protein
MAELRTGRLVLDASAVVRIIEGSEQSASFQEAVLNADLVLAPELMLTEVANALWRLQRAGQLAADGLQQRLSRAAELLDVIEPDRHLQVEALALACHFDHPVYDCLYLALARREAAMLLTADQRLQQLASRVLP